MGKRVFQMLGLCAVAGLAACTAAPTGGVARCAPGQGDPMRVYTLFFGRSVAGQGDVDDNAWAGFVRRVVAPNLPEGFTVWDADGAWLSPRLGRTVFERSKVLVVALPERPASAAAVERVRDAYRTMFHQQSVGLTAAPACGSF